ncbi:MAG: D-2-hydroxyacid dehydrogenase family protein [Rhodospirillaceae bacterium]|jgi:phosphoglycerate dehydrogenase-like enzyme|nr:D-2-hydroxyacid dehydrogenase family protein [Rhodospirillaceae bacterium]MBT4938813.1 D-2-hydroxyacid dehydrogenase family protein [Rhodospirillaceae bacterium]MBT5938294.1 D-2-hydroxyacid dehydrogenase family protein [Rhodospirillaceae bacterium]MBT7265254.1 D-2-hydroxyacid dehydrogenase family protein [Rhodospirillaceae bacterium]
MFKAAILDDYQNAAPGLADWDQLGGQVEFTFFNDHLENEDEIADRLREFEIVLMNRERTPFLKSQLDKLPNLKLLLTSGARNFSIDVAAAQANGVIVCGTDMVSYPTPELTWGLILSLARNIHHEDRLLREGGFWQTTVGLGLQGRVLGVVGLGRLGMPVAKIGQAFGMEIIAWSPNLTKERAGEVGVKSVTKEELFSAADFITLHMPLSDRSRGIVGADDIALMKPTSYLINTSRGPLVDEAALIFALKSSKIAGAGLDVFDVEPLPLDHAFRGLENTVLTPHLGYVVEDNYRASFAQMIENIEAWIKGSPSREMLI